MRARKLGGDGGDSWRAVTGTDTTEASRNRTVYQEPGPDEIDRGEGGCEVSEIVLKIGGGETPEAYINKCREQLLH